MAIPFPPSRPPLFEIETDKSNMEIEAFDEGTLLRIDAPEGVRISPAAARIEVEAGGRATVTLEAAGEAPDEKRVSSLALLNRENYINQGALPAMRHLGDQPAVATRLLRIADTKPGPNDAESWADRLNARRATALKALEGDELALYEDLEGPEMDAMLEKLAQLAAAPEQ